MAMAADRAAQAAGESGYWQLALIMAAIGFVGLFLRWRRMRPPPMQYAKEFRERDEDPNRYRDAADRALVELLETSRTLNAQVDTKIRMLNRLIKDAEEQCARLEGLMGLAKDAVPPANGPAGAADRGARSSRPTDSVRRAPSASRRVIAEKNGGPHFLSDLHERIYRLREDGKTVAEIAKATNLSTTEVEFIVKGF